MSRKVEFALATRRAVTNFDNVVGALNELDDIFKGSGYTAGGTNPITAADLAGEDITPQDLANISTFTMNINLFLTGGEPANFDYAAKIDAFRTMPAS